MANLLTLDVNHNTFQYLFTMVVALYQLYKLDISPFQYLLLVMKYLLTMEVVIYQLYIVQAGHLLLQHVSPLPLLMHIPFILDLRCDAQGLAYTAAYACALL